VVWSSFVRSLKQTAIAAAIFCLLALPVVQLVDRSPSTVLAEAEATPTSTSEGASDRPRVSATVAPVVLPSPTAEPTAVVTESVPSPTPGATLVTPSRQHVVREGDTLTSIAQAHGVSLSELVVLNRLADPDMIYVGQELDLPDATIDRSADEPTPTSNSIDATPSLSPDSSDDIIEERWIDVDISEQRLTAYDSGTPVRTTLVSTGLPNTPTPLGRFRIWIKFRFDDMAGADYYIEDVPYVMYFHEGYGLHGVTWHGNFGHPMSHGCVNVPTEEAEWLFNWAEVGTLVHIHE